MYFDMLGARHKKRRIKVNFGGLEEKYTKSKNARFRVIPVPYDLTTTYQSGSRRGPAAIIEASMNMELYDEELKVETYTAGIHTADFVATDARGPQQMMTGIRKSVENALQAQQIPVVVGGEHSVTFGAFEAVKKFHPSLTVLHFDAHADMRESYQGSKYSHACVAKRMVEFSSIVQVGIRSLSAEEALYLRVSKKVKTFFADNIHTNKKWQEEVLKYINGDIYITIDMDVFDPAVMPATGTPEPNGLSWHDVTALIKNVAQKSRIVGFDVVELAPLPGLVASDFFAAKLIYRIMGYINCFNKKVS